MWHSQHVYQLKTEPQVRARVNELWRELDMENPNKNLSKEGRKAMYKILERHMQVFTDDEVKVGCTDWVEMEIRLKEDARQSRPLSSVQKNNLHAQLDSFLKDGVIAPTESSV